MKDLNAVFQPEKISHAHGLQISYLHGEQMRNLFVYHEDGYVSLFFFFQLCLSHPHCWRSENSCVGRLKHFLPQF